MGILRARSSRRSQGWLGDYEHAMPYFSAPGTNRKACDVNGRQAKDQNFSAKKSSALILILILVAERAVCVSPPACVFSP